jgi:hypothetical protein
MANRSEFQAHSAICLVSNVRWSQFVLSNQALIGIFERAIQV